MLNYLIFIFVLLVIATFLDISLPKNKKTLLFILFVFLLWIASAFRYGDLDYFNYINAYHYGDNAMETGYLVLNKLFKYFDFKATSFLAFFAFLSVFFMSKFIFSYNKYVLVGLLIYLSHVFVLREMLQIRSGLAIGGCMFLIKDVKQRNLLKTIFFVFLFSTIHFVAFFWFLLYFIYPYFKSKKSVYILIISGIVFGIILNRSLFEFILMHTDNRLLYVYFTDTRFNYSLGLLNPVLIKHIIILAVLLYKYEFFTSKIPYFDILIVSYALAAFWLSTFNSFAIFAARIATLFSNVEHVLIPSLLFLKNKLIALILIVLYCFIAFYDKIDLLKRINFVFFI